VDNNYLDLGMNKSGFIHTLPSGRLSLGWIGMKPRCQQKLLFGLPGSKS
jgi:hypothetical protein